MSSISHSWNSPDWRQKRTELLTKIPFCQWCGKKDGEIYTDTDGKLHKVSLSVHHIERPKYGLGLYRKVAAKLFNIYSKTPDFQTDIDKTRVAAPLGLKQKEILEITKGRWQRDNKTFIKESYDLEKAKIIEGYTNFEEDEVLVLCNRCHYAREKGLVLCKVCKSKYHKPIYDMCWTCSVIR